VLNAQKVSHWKYEQCAKTGAYCSDRQTQLAKSQEHRLPNQGQSELSGKKVVLNRFKKSKHLIVCFHERVRRYFSFEQKWPKHSMAPQDF